MNFMQAMIKNNPSKFEHLVRESLRVQVDYINKLTAAGAKFWDYGRGQYLNNAV